MIYTNATGNHICGGVADMRAADGYVTNYANHIVTNENGQIVAASGGTMSLEKSMPLIKAMREEILMKSQKAGKHLLARKVVTKPRILKKSLGSSTSMFDKLLHDLDNIRLMRA